MNKRPNQISVDLYPKKFSLMSDEVLEDFTISAYGATTVDDFDYKKQSIDVLNKSLSDGYVSKAFHDLMLPLVTTSHNYQYTLTQLQDYRNNIATLPSSKINDREMEILDGMITVFQSSHIL